MNADNMTCEQVIEQLFEYLDQELDSGLSERIDTHLERCRDCFTRAEFEKKLRTKINETTEVKAPDRLHHRIRQVLNKF